MTFDRAIQLIKLERDYLIKKNEPESKQIRTEIAQALNIAIYALKAAKNIEQLFKLNGGADNG